jgi:hypothetical protein
VLTLLANMAAVKIKNARLLEAEQVRARSRAAARGPRSRSSATCCRRARPSSPATQFDAYLESCYAVGGDLFDFHRMPTGACCS